MRRVSRTLAVGLLGILVGASALWLTQLYAAIPSDVTTITPPPLKRVLKIVIDNGGSSTLEPVLGPDGQPTGDVTVSTASLPNVQLIVQGCDVLKDANGNPVNNIYGQPAYVDKPGWIGSKTISDPTVLQQYLPIWNQLMAVAEPQAADVDIRPQEARAGS